MFAMPGIDLRLQLVAPQEQSGISRRKASNEGRKSRPKGQLLNAGAGHGFVADEIIEDPIDLNAINADVRAHLDVPVLESTSLRSSARSASRAAQDI
jgi:hypothetical protein